MRHGEAASVGDLPILQHFCVRFAPKATVGDQDANLSLSAISGHVALCHLSSWLMPDLTLPIQRRQHVIP
jgi:hypothetical protein